MKNKEEEQRPISEASSREVINYLKIAPSGDYYEFGIYNGITFSRVLNKVKDTKIKCIGFDSFNGLPCDEEFFKAGQFKINEEKALENINKSNNKNFVIISGWFKDSLTDKLKKTMNPVSVALIDCDIYESTKHVLCWIESLLQDESILLFDDWLCLDQNHGEQKAFFEWFKHMETKWDYKILKRYEVGIVIQLRCKQ